MPAIEANIDLEGKPGLQTHVHEAELGMLEIEIKMAALARLNLHFNMFGLGVSHDLKGNAGFNAVKNGNEQDRAQVGQMARAVQAVVEEPVQIAFVDQGYTGEQPARAATQEGIRLEVVKHHEAKRGFVLLPRRWVVERSFAWAARFRRLARDYERLPSTLAAFHWLAFVTLMLATLFPKS
jgi:transposase